MRDRDPNVVRVTDRMLDELFAAEAREERDRLSIFGWCFAMAALAAWLLSAWGVL